MGWIAKPGSAEDKLNRWLTSKNQLRVALWLSGLFCGLAAWSMFEVLKPAWRPLTLLPVIFGVSAIVASHTLKPTERPTRFAWAASLLLALPTPIVVLVNSGILGSIVRAFR